jgi:peptide/nickel transport system ATP-binding protein
MSAAATPGVPLLQVEGLRTGFPSRGGMLHAVDGVDLRIDRGEILGLVGESGSGKSVTGFSILGLVDPPGRILGGRVLLDGIDLAALDARARRAIRGKRIAMIFQDPMMTLNPVLRIDTQMIEAVTTHEAASTLEARDRARAALVQVGIAAPDERLLAYPHQLSGGMRQRVAIAIALVNRPDLIIADEPTTALDVTIQGQILHEMQALVRESGTALVWITHDLSVVAGLADRVCVMYAGRIVESGPVDPVLDAPRHPYTRGLIDSVPAMNPRGQPLAQIPGHAPSPIDLPPGCAFHARCTRATQRCVEMPPLAPPADEAAGPRTVRCWNPVPLPEQASR